MRRSRRTRRHSQRQRDLPAHAVAYYVMALSLYRGVNTEEVLRVVTAGMEYLGAPAIRREVGKSSISAARSRLGAEVMQHIAERALVPLAEPQATGAFRSSEVAGRNGKANSCSRRFQRGQ